MSGNILLFELLPELLSTNQIGRFKSVQFPKNEFRNEVDFLHMSNKINWTWSGMNKHAQITSE